MLSVNPISLGENGPATPFRIATIADADYTSHDLTVKVAALPLHGQVFKADGVTQVGLGETVTAGELAALKFRPSTAQSGFATGSTIERAVESWFVLIALQNGKARPIGILAPGIPIDSHITITELPSNGIVLLPDGVTAVISGQTFSVAQLNGLTFAPADDASGKISILQYCSGTPERAVIGGVLLVVGPDAPPLRTPTVAAEGDSNVVAPLAVALLLDATLSSTLNPATLPAVASPSNAQAQAGEQASLTAVPSSDRVLAPSSLILTQAQILNADPTSMGGGSTPATDNPAPHRIGSSTPPLATTPASFTVLQGIATSTLLGTPSTVSSSSSGVSAQVLSAGGTGLLAPIATSSSASNSSAAPQVISLNAAPQMTSLQATPQLAAATTTASTSSLTANAAITNPIVLENRKPGTPESVWQINTGDDSTLIQGFTTAISTNVGGTVSFKIDNLTSSANYHVDIYRLGYMAATAPGS
jgi:hypothetical protein